MIYFEDEEFDEEPEEGDINDSGEYIYTKVGTTEWGTPIMKWKPWGLHL